MADTLSNKNKQPYENAHTADACNNSNQQSQRTSTAFVQAVIHDIDSDIQDAELNGQGDNSCDDSSIDLEALFHSGKSPLYL